MSQSQGSAINGFTSFCYMLQSKVHYLINCLTYYVWLETGLRCRWSMCLSNIVVSVAPLPFASWCVCHMITVSRSFGLVYSDAVVCAGTFVLPTFKKKIFAISSVIKLMFSTIFGTILISSRSDRELSQCMFIWELSIWGTWLTWSTLHAKLTERSACPSEDKESIKSLTKLIVNVRPMLARNIILMLVVI